MKLRSEVTHRFQTKLKTERPAARSAGPGAPGRVGVCIFRAGARESTSGRRGGPQTCAAGGASPERGNVMLYRPSLSNSVNEGGSRLPRKPSRPGNYYCN